MNICKQTIKDSNDVVRLILNIDLDVKMTSHIELVMENKQDDMIMLEHFPRGYVKYFNESNELTRHFFVIGEFVEGIEIYNEDVNTEEYE